MLSRRKGGMMASLVPAPQDSDPFADRRVYPRVSVALPAFLQVKGARHAVHLLDVSAGGAKLNCSVSLASGTAVQLDCGTVAREGVIRWQNGEQLGLAFDSPLDERSVAALIDRSTALAARMKVKE